ncbi:hypothetical protein T06_14519 [Trichinella sp. T6]|nr:hypothetical protein T06_14519 [Trichinella sp. T6]
MKRFCFTLASTIAFLWIVIDAAPLGLPYASFSPLASYLTLVDLGIEILSKDLIIMKNIELKSNWFL